MSNLQWRPEIIDLLQIYQQEEEVDGDWRRRVNPELITSCIARETVCW